MSPIPSPAMPRRRALFVGGVILAVVPVFYWLYTGQVWEDYLITFRTSHNWATGHGLTYEPGTRVYNYTSPLNVLLPAAFDYLTRTGGYAVPLALYNVLAVVSFVIGGIWLQRLLLDEAGGKTPSLTLLFPLILVLCARTTGYVVNGQEAGFWVCFLGPSFAALVRGMDQEWRLAGIGWCGLMWTRPDSPVYITILSAIALILPLRSRAAEFKGILKAAAICTVGYLPWFASTWVYYGSPFPNSALGKLHAYLEPGSPWPRLSLAERLIDAVGGAFAPIYYASAQGLMVVALMIGVVAILAWMLPGVSRLTRCASLAALGTVFYLGFEWSVGVAFPWYFVPACFFQATACTGLILGLARRPGSGRVAAGGFALVCVAVAGFFFATYLPLYAAQQQLIENDVRRPLGLWLKAHMKPGERLFLEPCGYIGYYSEALIYDYPGLTSPKVVALRRQGLNFYDLIEQLRPDWLVLRQKELAGFSAYPGRIRAYELITQTDNLAKINAEGWGGRGFEYDSHLYVFRRIQP